MNCEEVSKHLSEYLDKTLDTAMTTRVATHVISCALCRAESNELADCIHQVAALPAMDPPLGFAQRVMAHIHDAEPQASLWQRLIAPLSSRIPVRATAMALVAIFAIALYQIEQPLKKNNDVNLALNYEAQQAPTKEKPPALTNPTPTTVAKTPEIRKDAIDQAKVPTEAAKQAVAESSLRGSSASPSQPQQLQPAAPAPLRAEIERAVEEKKETPRRPPLRVQEVTTARDSMPVFGDPRGLNAPVGAMRQAPFPAPLALERAIPLGDRVADFEFVVRRRSPQRRDIIEHLGSADSLQKSTELSNPPQATGRAKIESIAEIRYYNVTPEHFEIFKKELAAEANIESEPKTSAKEIDAAKLADRQLLVKVTILPTDNAPPAR